MTTAQRNTTQHNTTGPHNTQQIATQRNATQCNTTGRHNTQLIATQPAQHDKTPDRYEIDGRAGRSTKNSTRV